MNLAKLKSDLERDEGRVPYAYRDSRNFITIGVGFLIDKDAGGRMPDEVIDFWLDWEIRELAESLQAHFLWFHTLDDVRQNVIVNMAFQLGINGLLKFKRFLTACQEHDFDTAADEILDSKAARQAPARFQRHATVMRTGENNG